MKLKEIIITIRGENGITQFTFSSLQTSSNPKQSRFIIRLIRPNLNRFFIKTYADMAQKHHNCSQ